MAAEDTISQELRNELEARISAWSAERAILLKAANRIAELDALIALAGAESDTFKVAPRPKIASPLTKPTVSKI